MADMQIVPAIIAMQHHAQHLQIKVRPLLCTRYRRCSSSSKHHQSPCQVQQLHRWRPTPMSPPTSKGSLHPPPQLRSATCGGAVAICAYKAGDDRQPGCPPLSPPERSRRSRDPWAAVTGNVTMSARSPLMKCTSWDGVP
jgi:hypothetical protein